jgi:hypothetical protein
MSFFDLDKTSNACACGQSLLTAIKAEVMIVLQVFMWLHHSIKLSDY